MENRATYFQTLYTSHFILNDEQDEWIIDRSTGPTIALRDEVKLLRYENRRLQLYGRPDDDVARELRRDLAAMTNERDLLVVTIKQQEESVRRLRTAADDTLRRHTDELRVVRAEAAADLGRAHEELQVLRDDWDRRVKEERARLAREERDRIIKEERTQLVKIERMRLIALLSEEEEESSRPSGCGICLAAPVEMLIEPCGHCVTCVACAPKVTKCPICRVPVVKTRRIFLQ